MLQLYLYRYTVKHSKLRLQVMFLKRTVCLWHCIKQHLF